MVYERGTAKISSRQNIALEIYTFKHYPVNGSNGLGFALNDA